MSPSTGKGHSVHICGVPRKDSGCPGVGPALGSPGEPGPGAGLNAQAGQKQPRATSTCKRAPWFSRASAPGCQAGEIWGDGGRFCDTAIPCVYIKPRVLPSRTLRPQMGVHSEPRGTSSNTCLRPFPSPAACTLVGRLRSRRAAGRAGLPGALRFPWEGKRADVTLGEQTEPHIRCAAGPGCGARLQKRPA